MRTLIAALLLSSSAGCSRAEDTGKKAGKEFGADEVAEASISFIRAHPELCEGKRVSVVGVIGNSKEATLLYLRVTRAAPLSRKHPNRQFYCLRIGVF